MATLGTGKILVYSGSFGRVKLAKNKSTGRYIALKMLKKSEIIKLKQVDHVANENKILSALEHPFIVCYFLFR
jgi:serine/threonine protein kinase